MSAPRYGVDDYIACLAFAGPPPRWDRSIVGRRGQVVGTVEHATALASRVDYIELIEEFCTHWFANNTHVDGQFAGFSTNYEKWYKEKQDDLETHHLARDHPMFGCGDM